MTETLPRQDGVAAASHPRVAILFQRFGPYHVARLRAAAQKMPVIGIEMSATDRTYAWAAEPCEDLARLVVSPDIDAEPMPRLFSKVAQALDRAHPDAVAIAGWSHPAALAALFWCGLRGIPAILMCDSAEADAVRRGWRERIKRRVVSLFASALVGGKPHRRYLSRLGMSQDAVFDGYDVVANDHFAAGAERARADAGATRARHALPRRPFFLMSSRMIAKKNLFVVLDAYRVYRAKAGPEAWDLLILGDGRLMPALREAVCRAGLTGQVHLPGFRQYAELPDFYGLAGAFILASAVEQWGLVVNEAMAAGLPVIVSNRCGCREDLVQSGGNGFAFEPGDPAQLARFMQIVAGDPVLAGAMASAGQRLIAEWGPGRFAANLHAAVEHAMAARRRPGLLALAMTGLLMLRREPPDD
ncbi:glycosyltransferase family 4 protein [Kaistia adipata]|uniref:glycosyltransferase family 4 protein n=1 Tax=Kaistia adipata TaxID=166954 RepID=UPI000415A3C6|nr:glycosyltransferase family 4 protein [Kaistia adipata]